MTGRNKKAAKSSKQNRTKRNKAFEENLADILRQAEAAGVLRWVLRGASRAFREIELNRFPWDSSQAKILRQRREIVVRHLMSLLVELDTGTKIEITRDLIGDLCCRGSKESCKRAKEMGLAVERDELATNGLFLLLRVVVPACCQLVKEGSDNFASEIVLHIASLIERLNELVDHKPELLGDIAGERIDWPVMASRHFPKKAKFQQLADRIGLASKSAVQPNSHQTWDPNTSLNHYLIEVLLTQCWGDGRSLTTNTISYYLDEVLMPLFGKVAAEEGGWENYPEFAAIAKSAAKRGKTGVQRSEIRNRLKKALAAMAR